MIGVTGANGFVASALCGQLQLRGFDVRRIVRVLSGSGGDECAVGDIGATTDWSTALKGVTTVIHCAARVHIVNDSADDPLSHYRAVNVDGTRQLVKAAINIGVKRLIFLSSVKVNGEKSQSLHELFCLNNGDCGSKYKGALTIEDIPNPQSPYGISKFEAEQILWQESVEGKIEVVVIRAPLVYGPGVGANFLRLIRLVKRGWPLPFKSIENYRSMVALDNLIDLLILCVEHPCAPGQTFFVSDGRDLSTPELIYSLASSMNLKARLFPVPPYLLRLGGYMIGRGDEVDRLIESLRVDITHTRSVLGWIPKIAPEEGLRRAVAGAQT